MLKDTAWGTEEKEWVFKTISWRANTFESWLPFLLWGGQRWALCSLRLYCAISVRLSPARNSSSNARHGTPS
jgi:hypothetical protein